jgi:ATP-dependent Clp protease ATP-binding subunit ClpC
VIEEFSPHCRQALAASEGEARALKHGGIATEHVLLGLLRVEESVAARALRLLGVTHRKVRRQIVRLVDVGGEAVRGPISFSPRVREILEDAYSGSVWIPRLVRTTIGAASEPPRSAAAPRLRGPAPTAVRTEELLLSLIAHGEGVAAHVLARLGVDLDRAAVAIQYARFPQLQSGPLPVSPSRWPPAPPKQN